MNDTSSSLDTSVPPKRPRKAPDLREVIPGIRYDKHEHWPIHREDRPRCFLCKEKMRLGCSKCEKGLCLTKDRNCFKIFMTYLTAEIGIFLSIVYIDGVQWFNGDIS